MAQTKFKVGDRVIHNRLGNGTIKFDDGSNFAQYIVEFDNPTDSGERPYCKFNHGWYCFEGYLTLIAE